MFTSSERERYTSSSLSFYHILTVFISGDEIVSLFSEFEDKSTPEAQFVNQLDKLEMVLQAREYELGLFSRNSLSIYQFFINYGLVTCSDYPPVNLQPFFSSTEDVVTHPAISTLDSAARTSRPHTNSEGSSNVPTWWCSLLFSSRQKKKGWFGKN